MLHLSKPRLETHETVMTVRNEEHIFREPESRIQSCHLWTDPSTVLQLIHSSQRKKQLLVANRTAELLDSSDVSQ